MKAVFPGSFDPLTLGHVNVIQRALPFYKELVIAIGVNTDKNYFFSLKERISFIESTFKNTPKVTVATYEGLTVDFCESIQASTLVRGLRNASDFEFEKAIAQTNRKLSGIETVFLLTSAETSFISSSIIRDILKNGGDISSLVPNAVSGFKH